MSKVHGPSFTHVTDFLTHLGTMKHFIPSPTSLLLSALLLPFPSCQAENVQVKLTGGTVINGWSADGVDSFNGIP